MIVAKGGLVESLRKSWDFLIVRGGLVRFYHKFIGTREEVELDSKITVEIAESSALNEEVAEDSDLVVEVAESSGLTQEVSEDSELVTEVAELSHIH